MADWALPAFGAIMVAGMMAMLLLGAAIDAAFEWWERRRAIARRLRGIGK